jgi:hypothetical protein
MSVLNKTVSYFPTKNATTQGVDVNLLTLLQSDKHKEIIQTLRASDAITQKIIKEKLPCFTPSGTFSRRCEEGILQRSGLAAVDLDSAEDYDCIHLLEQFKTVPSIAYAGFSCRGNRLWAIVPFLYPDKYVKHYERLIKSFAEMGLAIGDECHKQISQPRFVSWNEDSNQFFNHNAKPYKLLAPEKTFYTFTRKPNQDFATAIPENAFQWCNEQINKSHSFTDGNRHEYIIQLARYCNIKGLSEGETMSGCGSYVLEDFPESEILKIVKHIYETQKDSFNSFPFTEKKSSDENPLKVNKQVVKKEKLLIETSFLGADGKFYIPNPVEPDRMAVYENPEAYNQRLRIPTYVDRKEAEKLFLKWFSVDLKTLQAFS